MLRNVITAAALLLTAAGVHAAGSKGSEQLVRQYMVLRPELFQVAESAGVPLTMPTPDQLQEVARAFLPGLRSAPDWNSSHPDWKRMQNIIEADVPKMIQELSADAQTKQALELFNNALARGLASQLSDEQLAQLTQHYAQPDAVRFAAVEAYMLKQVNLATGHLQALAASGKRFEPPAGRNAQEVALLLSLMSEQLALQLGVVDPGPGQDRSGLQALPIMMGMAVSFSFDQIDAAWMALPEPQRAATLAWRASALAQAERQAIYEAGKSLGALPEFGVQMSRMGATMLKYQQKWKAQLNAAAPGR